MSENNQRRLFKEIIQFNPEKLQVCSSIASHDDDDDDV